MRKFKPIKGMGYVQLIVITILVDIALIIIGYFSSTYELLTVVRAVSLIFNFYELYYILLYLTLDFSIDENNLYITGNWGLKKVVIPFTNIEKYFISSGTIKGIRFSGHSSNNYAIGRTVLDKIGTTYMFVTSSKNIVYLKTTNGNFALSLQEINDFKEILNSKNINISEWQFDFKKYLDINKEKKFSRLLFLASVMVVILTVNPYIWYLTSKLPLMSPLSFDANFFPVKFGTAKQFAFKQMTYGVMNMAVLFCMYYAANFYGRYDKKTAYKFIYASILLSLVFLLMQFRILYNFR